MERLSQLLPQGLGTCWTPARHFSLPAHTSEQGSLLLTRSESFSVSPHLPPWPQDRGPVTQCSLSSSLVVSEASVSSFPHCVPCQNVHKRQAETLLSPCSQSPHPSGALSTRRTGHSASQALADDGFSSVAVQLGAPGLPSPGIRKQVLSVPVLPSCDCHDETALEDVCFHGSYESHGSSSSSCTTVYESVQSTAWLGPLLRRCGPPCLASFSEFLILPLK